MKVNCKRLFIGDDQNKMISHGYLFCFCSPRIAYHRIRFSQDEPLHLRKFPQIFDDPMGECPVNNHYKFGLF